MPNYEHRLSFIITEPEAAPEGAAPDAEAEVEAGEEERAEEVVEAADEPVEAEKEMATRSEESVAPSPPPQIAQVEATVEEDPLPDAREEPTPKPEPEAHEAPTLQAGDLTELAAPAEPAPSAERLEDAPTVETPLVDQAEEPETPAADEEPEEVPEPEPEPEPEPPPRPSSGRRKRVDLSSIKVMKANTGDFLEEREDEE
jgi:hypothetical protein